jgi:predicted alpha/beta hydrolase family esterase
MRKKNFGIFLAKYLSENKFPKEIIATFLVAAPYDDKNSEYSSADFKLKKDLSLLQNQSGKLFIYQSKDDDVVPFADFEKYKKALPNASFREFNNKKHFNQKNFPEIIREIRKIFI